MMFLMRGGVTKNIKLKPKDEVINLLNILHLPNLEQNSFK